MDNSKFISVGQLFVMVLLLQQGGLFWLLPYFLVRGNGTIGLSAILAGVVTAAAIIFVGRRWCNAAPDDGFINALKQRSRAIGIVVGLLLALFYLLFTIVTLYSFIDVTQKQLLEETPRMLLCVTVTIIVGWMSWSGPETIARMSVLSVAALMSMIAVSVVGTADLFMPEYALPLQLNDVSQFRKAMLHSVFCYSGLLVLFMVYPSVHHKNHITKSMLSAVGVGVLLLVLWTAYALCIFGQYSLQTILWIPAHLSRMVQISSFVEQTESLFTVLWMPIVLSNGSLLLWCLSQCIHQLLHQSNNIKIHGGVLLLLCIALLSLHNSIELLRLEAMLARGTLVLLPVLLLLTLFLTPKRGNGA